MYLHVLPGSKEICQNIPVMRHLILQWWFHLKPHDAQYWSDIQARLQFPPKHRPGWNCKQRFNLFPAKWIAYLKHSNLNSCGKQHDHHKKNCYSVTYWWDSMMLFVTLCLFCRTLLYSFKAILHTSFIHCTYVCGNTKVNTELAVCNFHLHLHTLYRKVILQALNVTSDLLLPPTSLLWFDLLLFSRCLPFDLLHVVSYLAK